MKRNILKWKEPKKYKKYLQNKTKPGKKIAKGILSILFISCLWLLFWVIAKMGPNPKVITFTKMLPIALGGGIALYIVSIVANSLYFDTIEFKEKFLFYFSNGIGNRIKYNEIIGFHIEKIELDNHYFNFLIIAFQEKKEHRIIQIELDPNIQQDEIFQCFKEKKVFPKPQS